MEISEAITKLQDCGEEREAVDTLTEILKSLRTMKIDFDAIRRLDWYRYNRLAELNNLDVMREDFFSKLKYWLEYGM